MAVVSGTTFNPSFTFSNSRQIKIVQTLLKNEGFYSGKIDGKLGSGTKVSLKKWQVKNQLSASGIFDVATKAALNKLFSSPVKIVDKGQITSRTGNSLPVNQTTPVQKFVDLGGGDCGVTGVGTGEIVTVTNQAGTSWLMCSIGNQLYN